MTVNGNLDTFLVNWNNSVPDQLKITFKEVTVNNLYRLLTDLITYWSSDQYVLTESGIFNDEVQGRAWSLSIENEAIFQIAITNSCIETQVSFDGTTARYWIPCDKFHIWVNMEFINNLRKNM